MDSGAVGDPDAQVAAPLEDAAGVAGDQALGKVKLRAEQCVNRAVEVEVGAGRDLAEVVQRGRAAGFEAVRLGVRVGLAGRVVLLDGHDLGAEELDAPDRGVGRIGEWDVIF